MVYLAGVSPLAWAVGAYLPIATTFPIFLGGCLRWLADKLRGEKAESEVSPGMLFATGLVAGGTLTGVAEQRPEGDYSRRKARRADGRPHGVPGDRRDAPGGASATR